MVDANQRWDVPTSISWMKALKQFNLLWIEEPTSPDDILGHKAISEVTVINITNIYIRSKKSSKSK